MSAGEYGGTGGYWADDGFDLPYGPEDGEPEPTLLLKRHRLRRFLLRSLLALFIVLVLLAGLGLYVFRTTVADVKHTPLLPEGVTQAPLPVGSGGGTPMNILLIGSDTRNTTQDCEIGGVCGPGANADVEMVLHVAADRSDATVMSIPRDTETEIPVCSTAKDGTVVVTGQVEGQINQALQDGPECQVAADHLLTGITFTGYVMVDFSAVVNISDALGGVPVCVTAPVYDKDSGLELPAGTSDVEGQQALAFLRTRHSFFDGSDLGREEAQHYFMAQAIRTLHTKLRVLDARTLLSVAQAMSQNTTVSDSLSGLSAMEGLARALADVPTGAITFLTMPWQPDPANADRVVPEQPAANQMFRNVQDDVSYTNTGQPGGAAAPSGSGSGSSSSSGSGSASASPAPVPTPPVPQAPAGVNKAAISIAVYNADGIANRAGAVTGDLNGDGYSEAFIAGDQKNQGTTQIDYPAGHTSAAYSLAATLHIPTAQVEQSSQYDQVTLVIGTDWDSGAVYTPIVTPPNTTGAATAPTQSFELNAGTTGECIPVDSGTEALG
jgi:LCP family protein required for cell wall assembly